jgi:hypothetical protein
MNASRRAERGFPGNESIPPESSILRLLGCDFRPPDLPDAGLAVEKDRRDEVEAPEQKEVPP